MNWRSVRVKTYESETVADTDNGRYVVRDATIWTNSRAMEYRAEAIHINGTETHLGYYPSGRAAIEACEQHAKGK